MSKSDKKRANSIITVSRFDNKLTFAFAGVGQFVFDPDKVSAENRARAMIHGFEQRIRDAAALSVDRDTGRSATAQEKHDAAKRIVDHLMSGATEWNLRPAATPGVDAGLTIQALMRVRGLDVDGANALVDKIATAKGLDRKAVLTNMATKNAEIIRATADIKAERAAEGSISAVDLLSEMMGDESDDDTPDEEDGDEEALM